MMKTAPRIGPLWDRLTRLPAGRTVFSLLVGRLARYSGTISPQVIELRSGYARVRMRDRRRIRNHLASIHAIALANLAELASGLALHYGLSPDFRAILVGITVDYHKKARGTLTAEAHAPVPEDPFESEYELKTEIRDEAGEVVATARARWLVGSRVATMNGSAPDPSG